ncbi:MAG TPA: hypothetical protein VKL61_09975 [Candidatus Polarisedimenticolia bacterium]|nr:hypothetical protein [Candidatus Polarisedimenticolia bacterium]
MSLPGPVVSEQTGGRTHPGLPGLVLLLAAGSLVPIWAVSTLPLQDLPNHLLKVDLFQRIVRGDPAAQSIYGLNLKLLANYSCYVALLLLAPLAGKMAAAKIFVSACLVLLPVAALQWLRKVNPENAALALAVPALGFNLFLMMGNLNFCLALPLYLFCLAALPLPGEAARRFSPRFMLLATLLYFTHGFVFLTLVGGVACLLLLDGNRALVRASLGLVPGLICLATTLYSAVASAGGEAEAFHPAFSAPGLNSIRLALVWLLNPHGWGFDTSLALGWIAVMAVAAWGSVRAAAGEAARGKKLRDLLRSHRFLALGGLLVLAYLAAPDQLRDWFHLRMRFSPLAVLTLLGGMKLPSWRMLRRACLAILVAAALAIQARNLQELRRRGADVEEYLAGMDAVEAGSSLLPVENLDPGPKYRANLHSWAYYAMEKGSWSPYLHAQPSYNPIVYRVAPWGPGEGMPLPAGDDLRRVAACYDYLILWNPQEGDAQALRPYYDLVRAHRRLRIWRNRAGVRLSRPDRTPECRKD